MNNSINKTSTNIIELLVNNQIKDAIDILQSYAIDTLNTEILAKINDISTIYRNSLEFTIAGVEDPEKEKIKNKIIIDLTELTDECRDFLLQKQSKNIFYQTKNNLYKNTFNIAESVENYILISSLKSQIEVIEEDDQLEHLFKIIVITNRLTSADVSSINSIVNSTYINSNIKCVIISALTLSNIRFFDKNKVLLIADNYYSDIKEVSVRSLFAMLFILHVYDFRINIHKELKAKVENLMLDEEFVLSLRLMMTIVIKTIDSKAATDKLKKEIIPEIRRISPELLGKIESNEINPSDINPEWLAENSNSIYEKLDELSSMQQSGFDIFIDAFSNLKRFPFFDKWSNWVMPYDENNSVILLNGDESSIRMAKVIKNILFMCNSDKYSFVLNISNLPDQQKEMLSQAIETQSENIKIDANEDMLFKNKEIFLIPQYVQDLYRLFKISHLKEAITDIFKLKLNFYDKPIFKPIFNEEEILQYADYYFKSKNYTKALAILVKLEDSYENPRVFEKIAFCYQQQGNLQKAIEYYEKALTLGNMNLWTMQKLAYCYRSIDQKYDALRVYLEAISAHPENIPTMYSLICLYMELNNHEKALQYAYKMEYFEPTNTNIIRAIGWCKFVLGDFDVSKKYFNRLSDNYSKTDHLNLGHIFTAKNNLSEAIHYYKLSISLYKQENKDFFKAFDDDKQYLIDNNVTQDIIDTVKDYLKYTL